MGAVKDEYIKETCKDNSYYIQPKRSSCSIRQSNYEFEEPSDFCTNPHTHIDCLKYK